MLYFMSPSQAFENGVHLLVPSPVVAIKVISERRWNPWLQTLAIEASDAASNSLLATLEMEKEGTYLQFWRFRLTSNYILVEIFIKPSLLH